MITRSSTTIRTRKHKSRVELKFWVFRKDSNGSKDLLRSTSSGFTSVGAGAKLIRSALAENPHRPGSQNTHAAASLLSTRQTKTPIHNRNLRIAVLRPLYIRFATTCAHPGSDKAGRSSHQTVPPSISQAHPKCCQNAGPAIARCSCQSASGTFANWENQAGKIPKLRGEATA